MDTQDSKPQLASDDLGIRNFFIQDDYLFIEHWCKYRGIAPWDKNELPRHGLILFHGYTPVCCGFLRRIEPNYFLMDALISNPELEKEVTDYGIDYLVNRLLKKAKELECIKVLAYTEIEKVLTRSFKHGFKELPHKVIAIQLQGDL